MERHNKPPPNSAGLCIFCGLRPASRRGEHIFARWMRRYIDKGRIPVGVKHTKDRIQVFARPGIISTENRPTVGSGTSRKRHFMDTKIPVVCEDCNNGWMSRIQVNSIPLLAPLLAGDWPVLDESGQTQIATWMTMFSMVNEFSDPDFVRVPQSARDSFMRSPHTPPAKWSIWIGRYEGNRWRLGTNHKGVDISLILPPRVIPYTFNIQMGTEVDGLCLMPSADST